MRFKIFFLPDWGSNFAHLFISLYIVLISNNLVFLDVDRLLLHLTMNLSRFPTDVKRKKFVLLQFLNKVLEGHCYE